MSECETGDHTYSRKLVEQDWYRTDDREKREVILTPRCTKCGQEQPARRPRAPKYIDERQPRPIRPPEPTEDARAVAEHVFRRAQDYEEGELWSCQGLFTQLIQKDVVRSRAESLLEQFMEAGWLSLRWKVEGPDRVLYAVALRDRNAIMEFARPGEQEARRQAKEQARERLGELDTARSRRVEALIESKDQDLTPDQIQVLAAATEHAASEEDLPIRVASARILGDSKAFERHRSIIENHLGDFEELGLIESSHLERIGGHGSITIAGSTIAVEEFPPFLGLAKETIDRIEDIDPGDDTVVFVENGIPFEACSRGEVKDLDGKLIVYTDGIPSSTVQAIAQLVAEHRVLVWADIDPEGVLIYEILLDRTEGKAEPYLMGPEHLAAERGQELTGNKRSRLEDMLKREPDHLLLDTLYALDEKGYWVEQERFL